MASNPVSFNKVSFYGHNRKDALAVVEARVHRRMKRMIRTTVPYKSRISGPCSSWEVFHRQNEAFEFVRQSGHQELFVWSYESEVFMERNGQRMYLAASLPKFWHYYSQLPTNQKHHYEVIPEGKPCKLYFDLEYSKEYNPHADGGVMTSIFIKYICYQLEKVYGLVCSAEHVLQLEASTSIKFSRHLIFNHNGIIFKDTDHAGSFVKFCCQELERILDCSSTEISSTDVTGCSHQSAATLHMCDCPRSGDIIGLARMGVNLKDIESLIISDKEGRRQMIFCDKGVYTKNRNFRLYLSCKLGKQNPLILFQEQTSTQSIPQSDKDNKRMFTASLVTNISDTTKLLSWEFAGTENVTNVSKNSPRLNHSNGASVEGCATKSPYPEVDAFVSSVVSHGNCHGKIRRWAYFSDAEVLTYDIIGNRYCHNIGRPHKSNNIMILADLRQGVYYQKCHDPECKASNYKSEEWPLPRPVLPAGILNDDDDTFDFFTAGERIYPHSHRDSHGGHVQELYGEAGSGNDRNISGCSTIPNKSSVQKANKKGILVAPDKMSEAEKGRDSQGFTDVDISSDEDDDLVTALDSFEKCNKAFHNHT